MDILTDIVAHSTTMSLSVVTMSTTTSVCLLHIVAHVASSYTNIFYHMDHNVITSSRHLLCHYEIKLSQRGYTIAFLLLGFSAVWCVIYHT